MIKYDWEKWYEYRHVPGRPVVRLHLPVQGVQVPSVIVELRSQVPPGQKTKTSNRKKYCNKFNEVFLLKKLSGHRLGGNKISTW